MLPDDHRGRSFRCSACNSPFSVAAPDAAARTVASSPPRIDRYEIRGRLGAGAFGTVYRAHDPNLEREVALKVLRAEVLDSPQAVERLRREARAVARLKHPHIVAVHDCGQDGTQHFIVYELIEGQTLAAALGESGLDPRRAAHLVAQVAEALGYAHEQKLLHRDVKPANIMLDGQDHAILVDFGLVRHGAALTQTGSLLGTPAYMAPEQLGSEAAQAGPASDLYSLGVTLYHLLTGAPPFHGPFQAVAAQILFQQPEPPCSRRPDLDPRLEAICLKAMARRPEDRYPSGAALASALREWLTGQTAPLAGGTHAPTREPAPKPAAPPALATATAARPAVTPTPTARLSDDRTEEKQHPKKIAAAPGRLLELDDLPTLTTTVRPARPAPRQRSRSVWLGVAVVLAGLAPLAYLAWQAAQRPAQEPIPAVDVGNPGRPGDGGTANAAFRAAFGAGQPHVLLIGIGDSKDSQIKPRKHAEDDARALYDLCISKDHLGAPASHVQLLLGKPDRTRPSLAATRANILAALGRLAASASRDDLVLIAFLGQGAPLGERGDRTCYFAADSTFQGRAANAIRADEIAEALSKLRSQQAAFFVDVNLNGFDPAGQAVPEASLGTPPFGEFAGDDGSDAHLPVPGRVVFLANNGLAPSLDLQGQGVFAHVLLKALKGEADREGYEPDGLVTVDELADYLLKELPRAARQFGANKKQKEQVAFVLRGEKSHFALTRNPAVTSRVRQRLDRFTRLAKDGALPAALVDEGLSLLQRMPRLQAQRDLRKEYQRLADSELGIAQFRDNANTIKAATRLTPAVATPFASKVLDAFAIVDAEYVKVVNRGELVDWAIRGLYKSAEEPIPADLAERLKAAKTMKDKEWRRLLRDARIRLGKREDLDGSRALTIALQHALGRLDRYSGYTDPERVERKRQDYTGHFTGIGAQLRKEAATGGLRVTTPIKDSPAYKAGLATGDLITTLTRQVDSKGNALDPPEVLFTRDLTLTAAIAKIMGKAGTKIKLTVQREGTDKPLEFEITRGRIEVETVLGVRRKADDSWDYFLSRERKIACVRLTGFGEKTAADLGAVLASLKSQGVAALILDLRFNGGGLLRSCTQVADLFIKDGLIVTTHPRNGKVERYEGKVEGSYLDFPMVCLVNDTSASASEIVAACLQDHGRARIIGERTYGKGSVQNVKAFEGGEISLTTSLFKRSTGKSIDKASAAAGKDDWGVVPDLKLNLTSKEKGDLQDYLYHVDVIPRADRRAEHNRRQFRDRQRDMALEYLEEALRSKS